MSDGGGTGGESADRRGQLFPGELDFLHALVARQVTYLRKCADRRPRGRCRDQPCWWEWRVLEVWFGGVEEETRKGDVFVCDPLKRLG